jgi:hypothetical protein
VRQTYKIDAALKGRGRKTLRCASAWVAYEQRDRLVRQGWTVNPRPRNEAGCGRPAGSRCTGRDRRDDARRVGAR